ncbi:SET domain-containing protein, partial [Auricularia subglabra TFB-10046 SS5]
AYEKLGRTYLFAIDNCTDHVGDKSTIFVVDAFRAGNFTRFLNHCCEPNCVVVSVHINEPNIYKPFLCIFTNKEIGANEELTLSYRG